MFRTRIAAACVAVALAGGAVTLESRAAKPFRIEVSFPATLETKPLDGRIILVISRRDTPPPINAQMRGNNAQPMFGIDVEGLKPGQTAVFDDGTRGWPVESLRDLPPGDYFAQAVLNVYTTVTRADGHTIKVHLDQGEGQNYRTSPGNLVSRRPEDSHRRRRRAAWRRSRSTRKNPPIEPPHGHEVRQARAVQERDLSADGGAPTSTSAPSSFSQRDGTSIPTRNTRCCTTRATSRARSPASATRRPTPERPTRSAPSRRRPTASIRTGSPARWGGWSSC